MSSKVGLEHLGDFERRRSLRFVLPRQEDITLFVAGQAYQGKLEDVSIGGAKLRMAGPVPAASELRLAHETAGTIDGVCQWHAGEVIGISFELSDPALHLISLCLRQGVPGRNFAA
ncbi:MAG: PilZ domain-containing protein [Kiloniellaceae bacterium]